jgi:hypothetical protein
MSIYQEAIPYDEFNPMKDKIAVMLRAFTIRRGVGLGDRKYSEPYFICIAIPESGNAKLDKVELSTRYHPKTRRRWLERGYRFMVRRIRANTWHSPYW